MRKNTVEIFCTCDNWLMGGMDYHCYCNTSDILEVAHRMKEWAARCSYKNVRVWTCNSSQWTQKVCEMGVKQFNEWAEKNCKLVLA